MIWNCSPWQRKSSGHWALIMCVMFALYPLSMATTIITNTRSEIAFMAGLWEAETIQISGLANAQYPRFSNDWQYIFPSSGISADGDLHVALAVDAIGDGRTNNNTEGSPIIAEIVNVTTVQVTNLQAMKGSRANPRGIFRFYTEHLAERHFEVHPLTELYAWAGSAFVLSNSYRANIKAVTEGVTWPLTTLSNLFNGSQKMTATVATDGVHVVFTYPTYATPSVNYAQYNGLAASVLLTDAVSDYLLFQPDLVSEAVVKCRLVTNTLAAEAASNILPNNFLTVNALTRTDMLAVSNRIASLKAGETSTFARPLELIVLGITNRGPAAPRMLLVGLTNGGIGLELKGVSGSRYAVLASTDLCNWLALETNVSPFSFVDTNGNGLRWRFYKGLYVP